MNDRMILENVLSLLKGICTLHLHGSIEAACPNVNGKFKEVLADTLTLQHSVYDAMKEKGWYQVTQEQQQKIDQAKQKFASDCCNK